MTPFFLVLTLAGHWSGLEAPSTTAQANMPRKKLIAAPIHYEEFMLILTNEHGTALVVFDKEQKKGVHYKFRYRAHKGNRDTFGEGVLVQKYRVGAPIKNSRAFELIDEGSILLLKAEAIYVEWSWYMDGGGWIYYAPEELRVQPGRSSDFRTLDITRFKWVAAERRGVPQGRRNGIWDLCHRFAREASEIRAAALQLVIVPGYGNTTMTGAQPRQTLLRLHQHGY